MPNVHQIKAEETSMPRKKSFMYHEKQFTCDL